MLDSNCIVGHSCELKTSIMFAGSKIAHLNFVGDSLLGYGVTSERLMLYVGADNYQTRLQKSCAKEMDFTGKALKGFIYMAEKGVA